ncbi:xylulokinase [Eleftheria terrae]|uniref:xylulokinase n=1 Tax=Eleftheria terrae TaxID=1597781 RepID=UPI00263B04DF|nr:xylulokinase [Eleftheria terrae]WKB53450.1 xylulokinase [Eleftheria terrae]
MTGASYLGIDLGTSEVKLVLLDTDHRLLGSAGAPLVVDRPRPHWSEQSPQAWWQATQQAAAALRQQLPQAWASVRAIGLSGQMHGATLLDDQDRVLRPAILWNDTRSAAECAELDQRLPELPALAGNLAMPGFTAPKLMWVARHEPELFRRVASVLLPKDYLRWCLTGRKLSDMSDAAGTLWLDVARRAWSPRLLEATGMALSQMPELVEGSAAGGRLHAAAARALGLAEGTLVAGGAGDNAASAVGIGAVAPGDGFVSLGTSGVLFVVTDRYRPNPASAVHAFCHALPGRWHQMSVMLSAASCLRWVTRLTGMDSEAALLQRVAALGPAAAQRAPIFLPYLSGERTPHNDAQAQGLFFGLDHETDAARLGQAVLEGVSFGLLDGLQALQAAGTAVQRLALVGGGARSAYWAQLLADVLQVEIQTLDGGETGGALGAARLAWLADGGPEAVVCVAPPVRQRYAPDPARHDALAERHRRFQALYRRVQDLYPR